MIAEALLAVALLAPAPVSDWTLNVSPSEKWLPFYEVPARLRNDTLVWHYNPKGEPGPWALGEIQAAAAEWAEICGIEFVYAGTTTRKGLVIDGVNSISWAKLDPSFGGWATGSMENNVILETDIEFNPDNITTPDAVRAIARHELGHAIGIAHSDVEWAAMSGPPYSNYRWPYVIVNDDVVGCRALYGTPKMSKPLRW